MLAREERLVDALRPRRSTLGHDFGRLGFSLIDDLKAIGTGTVAQLDSLDRLVDYRNAIGHGDEVKIGMLESTGAIKATKKSYQEYRRTLDGLASTIDMVVASGLSRVLEIPKPW